MKKISYVLGALATIAIAVPSIASAEDKPMMKDGMKDEGMKKLTKHHHRYHHRHVKKTMKKEGI